MEKPAVALVDRSCTVPIKAHTPGCIGSVCAVWRTHPRRVARGVSPSVARTPLGIWNNKCVVESTNSDETITWDSDDTWAQGTCANFLAANSTYVPFPTNNARPGSIQYAFIHLYGSGLWREFSDYANPPSGDEQIAVRSTYWSDAAA